MALGYWNRVIRIDLTSASVTEEYVDDDVWMRFVGGAGYGTKVMIDETPPKLDPFSPENKIIYAVGPFQSYNIPGSGKWSVVTRSPLTNTHLDTAGAADFGVVLKKTGFDAIVIEGKADKPVCVVVSDGDVRIEDAGWLWGKDAYDTAHLLKGKYKGRVGVVAIGQSGERLVRMANIVVDGHSFCGRGGAGAVMGSKNLKAVVVAGSKNPTVYDPDTLRELVRDVAKRIVKGKAATRKNGTVNGVLYVEEIGDLPMKYWDVDTWKEGARKLGAPFYTEFLQAKPLPCANCPVGCHRKVRIPEPYNIETVGPEYETVAMLGSNLLIDDLTAVAYAGEMLNRYGVDTISVGAAIGFLMDLYEQGIVKKSDIGVEVNWGDSEVMLRLVREIALAEGKVGELFKDGVRAAAERIGKEALDRVVEVKGLDYPAHDPRAVFALAINYATGTRGACHQRGNPHTICAGLTYPELGITEKPDRFDLELAAKLAVVAQNTNAVYNSLSVCDFMMGSDGMTLTDVKNLINAVTGWEWEVDTLVMAGERIFNLQRLINIRDGYTAEDDKLPLKMRRAASEGGRAGKTPEPFDRLKENYYRLRGWTQDGIPTEELVNRLDIP